MLENNGYARFNKSFVNKTSLVLLSALLLLQTGCEKDKDSPPDYGDNDPSYAIALGDSITAAGFTEILTGMTGIRVENSGMPGAFAQNGADIVDSALTFKPGFLLIMFGSNDLILGIDRASTIEHLRYIIRQAKANKTVPIIATIPGMIHEHAEYQASVLNLNGLIANLAKAEGAIRADVYAAMANNPAFYEEDGLHPNEKGNNAIASAFRKRMQ